MRIAPVVATVLLAGGIATAIDVYTTASQKFEQIGTGTLRPGTRVDLSIAELNAIALHEAPAGVRNPRLTLSGNDTVSGSALVDFGKMQRAMGYQPGWLMSKLLDGERTVKATARIRSGGGKVTVDVTSVDVNGLVIDGGTLDFLIQNVVVPLYPAAVVGRPVDMGFRIDRLQLAPAGVAVLIGR